MEKVCEFCKVLRPVVYCKADAAHLCFPCDAKVHSANALSFRHPRTVVCEICRCNPAEFGCQEHNMFICRSCESGHDGSCRRRRRGVSYYTGCPSASDLAALWQLDLSEAGSSAGDRKVIDGDTGMQSSYSILQRIVEMNRLQLSETATKEHKSLSSDTEYFAGGGVVNFQEEIDNPFWQCKIPVQNNEVWMQDLGVCDEIQCFDDVNIPDVNFTFENFDEIFGDENETCFGIKDEVFNGSSSSNTIQHKERKNSTFDNQQKALSDPLKASSYSAATSFSISRISNESGGSEYRDDGHSLASHNSSRKSHEPTRREKVIMRYKEKKVVRHERQAQYAASVKAKGEVKRRGQTTKF